MNKTRGVLNIGFTSILTVFVMICIVTFSILTWVSANSDYNLSQKTAEKTAIYYEATSDAETLISEIDTNLMSLYKASTSKEDYFTMLSNYLQTNSSLSTYTNVRNFSLQSANEPSIHFSIILSDLQSLEVTLQLNYPTNEDYLYEISQYKVATLEEVPSTEDTMLNLLQ